MKLGFLTNGDPADAHFAAREGYDCLELALFGDTPLFDDPAPFAQALAETGVALAAVSLFGQNYFDGQTGAACQARLRRVLALCAHLKAPIVVWGTGTPPGGGVGAAVDMVRPFVADAQARGLTAALYNCSWENVIDRPAAWDAALPRLAGAGIKFDPSHPFQARRDWKAELLAAGPRLVHAHAKDVLEVGGRFVADPNPGLGDIRWESFFGILYHVGYSGAVCVEPHSPLYTGARRHEFLRLSRRYLGQFIP